MHILDRLFGGPNPTKEQAEAYVRGQIVDLLRERWIDVPVRTRRLKNLSEMTSSEAYNASYCPTYRFTLMRYEDLYSDCVFPIYDTMTKEDIGL